MIQILIRTDNSHESIDHDCSQLLSRNLPPSSLGLKTPYYRKYWTGTQYGIKFMTIIQHKSNSLFIVLIKHFIKQKYIPYQLPLDHPDRYTQED